MQSSLVALILVLVSGSAAADSLDKEAIRRPIRRQMPKITRCFENQLMANPKLIEGDVTANFVIGRDGRVVDATAKGFDDALASCVASVIRGIKFAPSPSGEIRIAYPFHFRR